MVFDASVSRVKIDRHQKSGGNSLHSVESIDRRMELYGRYNPAEDLARNTLGTQKKKKISYIGQPKNGLVELKDFRR
jgi:hypothetical protein